MVKPEIPAKKQRVAHHVVKSPPSAASFGDEALLAPEATSASAASGLLFQTATVCPAFKMLAAIREPISSETEKSNFAHIYCFFHASHIA